MLLADDGPAVSVPMLSAAAGVLLAVEIAKHSYDGAPGAPGHLVRTSILTGPHHRWYSQRHKTADCQCTEAVYQNHYKSRWPA